MLWKREIFVAFHFDQIPNSWKVNWREKSLFECYVNSAFVSRVNLLSSGYEPWSSNLVRKIKKTHRNKTPNSSEACGSSISMSLIRYFQVVWRVTTMSFEWSFTRDHHISWKLLCSEFLSSCCIRGASAVQSYENVCLHFRSIYLYCWSQTLNLSVCLSEKRKSFSLDTDCYW